MRGSNITKNKKSKFGIILKTSLICGAIVLVLLVISNFIFIRLESSLVHSIINTYAQKFEKNIDDEGDIQKKALTEEMKVRTDICATISASFLYNIDKFGLEFTLKPYMNIPEIRAIKVLDYVNQPFFSYWRDQGVQSGTAVPGTLRLNEDLSFKKDSFFDEERVGQVKIYFTDTLLQDRLNESKQKAGEEVLEFRVTTDSGLNRVVTIQTFVAFFVVLVLIVTITFSLNIITVKPIKRIIDRIRDVAEGEGDLTSRLIARSRDEMSELARWFNTFMDKLQAMIKNIAGNADILNRSSSDLSALSGQMADSASQMSTKVSIVASSGEEMSSNMESVAATMEQTSTNTSTVASSVDQMTDTINEIAQNSEKARTITGEAVSRTEDASVKLDQLGKAAQEIGKVTEAITEISEQTNLLALNATIEAARAGEAGKGFAVVANEIKDLARQTAEATQEIKGQIKSIQDSTSGTITEIGEILNVINDVNEIVSAIATSVEEQSVTTKEIAGNIAQASEGIQEVNTNVAQSSSVSKDIAAEIMAVSQAVSEITNNSSQVNLNSKELNKLAEELKELVNRFKV